MLRLVDVAAQPLEPYIEFAGEDALERLRALASHLRGARILQLNATPYGGGVAELLNSLVPLERGLGIDVRWGVVVGEPAFFGLTKRLHNALQGDTVFTVSQAERDAYLLHNRHVAEAIAGNFDIVVVHDPQPAPSRGLNSGAGCKWIWRAHLDLAAYNPDAWEFLSQFIEGYDAYVFTMEQFVPAPLDRSRVHCFPPGIDPLSPKNLALPGDIRDRIVRWMGLHLDRPLLTQVSRFDPWKDPHGVLRLYRELRREHPKLQLALLGSMALDDPEAWAIYDELRAKAADEPDVHVLSNFAGISNMEVNAFQSRSDVVIQKSIREGFGLVVSETIWKGTPIVAGNTGGIPLQMVDGQGGYLVSSEEDWAKRVSQLLSRPEEARHIGEQGRERVRERFLITRLLEDELRLLVELQGEGDTRGMRADTGGQLR